MLKVTCAIIEHENRVLVTQRGEAMPDPLLWEFPGGKMEPGETEEECLAREIKEELNITIQPLQRLTPVLHRTQTKTIELIPYICTLRRGDIKLLEHRDYKWSLATDLHRYNWCLPDLPVVEEYLRLREYT
ncbi:(deoxy)nucleoside triphosphate pyrophosphohydrolase [Pontibacter diazotrophicus]|uniref:8-oxo-dGTP diphosphatase n=1 Tax=Pontibacter diazotrophicus TaxID=1400979 RepID=A0A3D8LG43_9BACT|nr:(deoxy)nucleoside triphosphate pyrophosphohydrolase [Pontibacter diazotrophicus]RDV16296.1 (deoxy)nucleoside triphosphate pyrophosphohydrolase [Pontibacter diazotrophicus]